MNDNKNNNQLEVVKLKRGFYLIIGILVIGLIFTIIYYNRVKNKADTLDIEDEMNKLAQQEAMEEAEEHKIKKRIDDLKDGSATPGSDLLESSESQTKAAQEEFDKLQELRKNAKYPETIMYNKGTKEFTDDIFKKYKKKVAIFASQYNWDPILDINNELVANYDFTDKVEAYYWLQDVNLLSEFHSDNTDVDLDYVIRAMYYIRDPELFSYVFFSIPQEMQAQLLKEKDSVLLYTKNSAPKVKSVEEVPPRKHGIENYYVKPSEVKTYKVVLELEQGDVDFIIVNNKEKITEPIRIRPAEGSSFEFVTYEQYENEHKK